MIQGVHQEIPEGQIASPGYKLLSPPVGYRPPTHNRLRPISRLRPPMPTVSVRCTSRPEKSRNMCLGRACLVRSRPTSPRFRAFAPLCRAGWSAQSGSARSPTQAPATPLQTGGRTVPSASPPPKPATSAAAKTPEAPKPKPTPTAPILVTDPTDADPDAVIRPRRNPPPLRLGPASASTTASNETCDAQAAAAAQPMTEYSERPLW